MEKLLSLVVPAFNEEEAMEQSFERTYRAMSSIGYPFEIIYIDDGSRDRTWEIISAGGYRRHGRGEGRRGDNHGR